MVCKLAGTRAVQCVTDHVDLELGAVRSGQWDGSRGRLAMLHQHGGESLAVASEKAGAARLARGRMP